MHGQSFIFCSFALDVMMIHFNFPLMLDSVLTTLQKPTHFYDHEKYITDTHGTDANKNCFEHFPSPLSSVKQAAGSGGV